MGSGAAAECLALTGETRADAHRVTCQEELQMRLAALTRYFAQPAHGFVVETLRFVRQEAEEMLGHPELLRRDDGTRLAFQTTDAFSAMTLQVQLCELRQLRVSLRGLPYASSYLQFVAEHGLGAIEFNTGKGGWTASAAPAGG